MKKAYLGSLFLLGAFCHAQVGIKTKDPKSTLDITATNSTGTSNNVDGLLVPRVDRQRAQSMTGTPTSTMIFVNSIATGGQTGTTVNVDAVGYYYFNGSVWVKLDNPNNSSSSSVNIYNSDGTLTGNRIVTQGSNTLTFNSNAVNGFSVDSNTLSVDAANHRIGIGNTAPTNKLTVVDATNTNQYQGIASILANNLTQGVGIGWAGIQSIGTNVNADLNLNAKNIGNIVLQTQSTGNVGVGTSTPQKLFHVNGTMQLTNEFNVGGNAATAGSAGTAGQILTSGGAGAAPTWQTPSAASNVNIYNSDGTLTGNRIVTQGTNTLAFTSNAVNGFSVDGSTLSVDALNNRVGIGTASPNAPLQFASNVSGRKIVLYEVANNDNQFSGFGINPGVLRYQVGSTGGNHIFYSGVDATTSNELMRIQGTGNVGIGTSTPQKLLHINGSMQLTDELNVGGNATTAGSAGTTGQILTSGGAGAAPTWQTPSAVSSVNIYNSDGTLTGNRIVTQGARTLAFTGSTANAFSVDGTTFSVDASNNRVGIGSTTPSNKLTVVDATNSNQYQGIASILANNLTQGVGIGWAGIQAIGTNANADLNLNAKNAGNLIMQTQSTGVGRVGIGTSTPTAKLEIVSDNIGSTGQNDLTFHGYGTSKNTSISLGSANGTVAAPSDLVNGDTIGGVYFSPRYAGSFVYFSAGIRSAFRGSTGPTGPEGLSDMIFRTSSKDRLTIDENGNVGIGTTNPTQKLHVLGNILASGTITPSDIRIKKDITDNTYGLKEIMGLRTIGYKYKDENLSKDHKIGFVAQEVKATMPELVSTADDKIKTLGVNYAEMTVVLAKAMQEQQKQIEELKLEIAKLKAGKN